MKIHYNACAIREGTSGAEGTWYSASIGQFPLCCSTLDQHSFLGASNVSIGPSAGPCVDLTCVPESRMTAFANRTMTADMLTKWSGIRSFGGAFVEHE